MFRIETYCDPDGWSDDPSRLGHGLTEHDNQWQTEAEAMTACDELASGWGWDRSFLRVVRVDG